MCSRPYALHPLVTYAATSQESPASHLLATEESHLLSHIKLFLRTLPINSFLLFSSINFLLTLLLLILALVGINENVKRDKLIFVDVRGEVLIHARLLLRNGCERSLADTLLLRRLIGSSEA